MPRKFWTPDRIDRLKDLIREKASTKAIATYFGLNEDAVRQQLHRLQVTRGNIGQASTALSALRSKSSQVDLATRIRMLLGDELLEERPTLVFTDEQLRCWIDGVAGFTAFCEDVLTVSLQDYQLHMAEAILTKSRCCFVLGRQSGKDFTISCLVVWLAITRANQKLLIISPSQRQSDLLYERILEHVSKSDELYYSVDESNKEKCTFKNGSYIRSLPSTTFIRGETAVNFAFLNEARDFVDQNILAHVAPMLGISQGKLVILSSPGGCSGVLWDCFNNPFFFRLQLPTSINKYFPAERLEEERQLLSSIQYAMEYDAQFGENVNNFFSAELIHRCSKPYDFCHFPDAAKSYYLGIDWGRIKDSSVFTVVSLDCQGIIKVENIVEMDNAPFDKQIGQVLFLQQRYHFSDTVAERAGLSLPLVERLKREQLRVTEFTPTIESKTDAFNRLLRAMDEDRVIIPSGHLKLKQELNSFRYEVTPNGKMKLHHASENQGDDFVDSLCYACYGALTPRPSYFMGGASGSLR